MSTRVKIKHSTKKHTKNPFCHGILEQPPGCRSKQMANPQKYPSPAGYGWRRAVQRLLLEINEQVSNGTIFRLDQARGSADSFGGPAPPPRQAAALAVMIPDWTRGRAWGTVSSRRGESRVQASVFVFLLLFSGSPPHPAQCRTSGDP